MSVTRILLPGQPITTGGHWIPAAAARHLRVSRVAPGELVETCDLAGAVGVGRLVEWRSAECLVEITEVVHGRGEPPAPLVLALAVLHTQAFDWAVEKATELGATEVVPVVSERVQGHRHDARVERWQRVADAAVAQCGRSRSPRVAAPVAIARWLADPASGVRLVADPDTRSLPAVASASGGVTVLVGPEGGFTEAEVAAIAGAGYARLPLGPRVLRAETAAVAGLAVAQALAGWAVSRA